MGAAVGARARIHRTLTPGAINHIFPIPDGYSSEGMVIKRALLFKSKD